MGLFTLLLTLLSFFNGTVKDAAHTPPGRQAHYRALSYKIAQPFARFHKNNGGHWTKFGKPPRRHFQKGPNNWEGPDANKGGAAPRDVHAFYQDTCLSLGLLVQWGGIVHGLKAKLLFPVHFHL